MQFVFWQNIISPHQAPFLRSLANMGHDVIVVTIETMAEDRIKLGWQIPDLGKAGLVSKPTPSQVSHLVEETASDSVHIMAGARWYSLGNMALEHCRKLNRRVGILTEAPDPRGLGGFARWARYSLERCTAGSRYHFILAMGEMGVSWFRHCGYATDKIFPFSYITEGNDSKKSSSLSKYLSFLYVGQFITRKGLDILMRAFAKTGTDRACLNLLGDGPDKSRLQNLSRTLGIADRVSWHPKRDAFGAQIEMGKADVTVLPSRHDGWGAVVNESLMMGTPVICSTACGAAELIREPWLGSVFRSGHVADLARALQFWIDQGPRTQPERERIRKWAKCIQGQAVANYFIAIMEHVYSNAKRPVAPWRLPLENR